MLSAVLVEGGTWRTQLTFREALADPRRMRLALVGRLAELPAPADALRLRVEAFGPPAGDQRSLLAEPAAIRRARLREAVRQARAVAGPGRRAAHPPRRSRLARARAPPRARAVGAMSGPRRSPPRARRVATPPRRPPRGVDGRAVEAVRESWLVEDRWWTDAPLRRRYWEVVSADGRDLVVYRELEGGGWFTQR